MPDIRILDQSNRQGTLLSASYRVAALPSKLALIGDIDWNDRIDENNSAVITMERSPDDGETWIPIGSMTWEGGRTIGKFGEDTPNPTMTPHFDPAWIGQRVRTTFDIPRRMKAGAILRVE